MSQQPLNPIKVTAQAGDRENWATVGTRHLANHPYLYSNERIS